MLRHTEVRGKCNQSLNGHDGLPSMVGAMGRRYRVVSSEVKSRSRSEPGNHRLGTGNSRNGCSESRNYPQQESAGRIPRLCSRWVPLYVWPASLLWATTGYERTQMRNGL